MKSILTTFLVLSTAALAATEKAPASRISTVTNNYHILTGNVAQVNFNEIDGWLTNHSGRIDGATNLAQQAYDAATGGGLTNVATLQEQFNHRTYVYTHTNSLEIANATAGLTQFTVPTQSIGKIHVGMYVSNTTIFASNSMVTSVDWTNMIVGIDKTIVGNGSSTSCFAVATGTASAVTFTHVVPSGYSRCKVTVTGSGATGAADNDSSADAGSGGGGGGTGIAYLKLVAGESVSITSGRKPALASAGNDGNSGNTSSFGSYVTSYGGTKGTESDSTPGGNGGAVYGATIAIIGGQGDPWNGEGRTSNGGGSYFGAGNSQHKSDAPYGVGGSGWQSYNSINNWGVAGNGVVIVEYY